MLIDLPLDQGTAVSLRVRLLNRRVQYPKSYGSLRTSNRGVAGRSQGQVLTQ